LIDCIFHIFFQNKHTNEIKNLKVNREGTHGTQVEKHWYDAWLANWMISKLDLPIKIFSIFWVLHSLGCKVLILLFWWEYRKICFDGQKSCLVVSKLASRLEGFGFESHPILDGNGVKAMPGSIPAPNPVSFNNWKERKYR